VRFARPWVASRRSIRAHRGAMALTQHFDVRSPNFPKAANERPLIPVILLSFLQASGSVKRGVSRAGAVSH
jgi:hypothetical protein